MRARTWLGVGVALVLCFGVTIARMPAVEPPPQVIWVSYASLVSRRSTYAFCATPGGEPVTDRFIVVVFGSKPGAGGVVLAPAAPIWRRWLAGFGVPLAWPRDRWTFDACAAEAVVVGDTSWYRHIRRDAETAGR